MAAFKTTDVYGTMSLRAVYYPSGDNSGTGRDLAAEVVRRGDWECLRIGECGGGNPFDGDGGFFDGDFRRT